MTSVRSCPTDQQSKFIELAKMNVFGYRGYILSGRQSFRDACFIATNRMQHALGLVPVKVLAYQKIQWGKCNRLEN
jgi:hypothetical protein